MRLLLDENCAAKELAERLRGDGHDVQTVITALGAGASDSEIVAYALAEGRIIITKDVDDFVTLLAALEHHPGLLLVREGRHGNQMSPAAMARAVRNVGATYAAFDSMIAALNEFVW